jgi:hypothetical protein
LFLLFLDNLVVILGSLTLQGKHNIHTLSEKYQIHLHTLQNRTEKLAVLPVYKVEQINYIFSDNVHILSMYLPIVYPLTFVSLKVFRKNSKYVFT